MVLDGASSGLRVRRLAGAVAASRTVCGSGSGPRGGGSRDVAAGRGLAPVGLDRRSGSTGRIACRRIATVPRRLLLRTGRGRRGVVHPLPTAPLRSRPASSTVQSRPRGCYQEIEVATDTVVLYSICCSNDANADATKNARDTSPVPPRLAPDGDSPASTIGFPHARGSTAGCRSQHRHGSHRLGPSGFRPTNRHLVRRGSRTALRVLEPARSP